MRRHAIVASSLALAILAGRAGAQNQAIALVNGTSGFVSIPNSPTLVPPSITVEAWVNFNNVGLNPTNLFPTILRKNPAFGQEAYFLRVQGIGALRWKVKTPAASVTVDTPAPMASGAWTHVAGTYDGATARLYLNGVQVASAIGTGAATDTGGELRIGKGDDTNGTGETWSGQIDEVRLWSVARTQAQIQATKNFAVDNLPGLVSVWHFDGVYLDSTGQNHGTPNGNVTFTPSGAPVAPGLPQYQVNSAGASIDFDGVQGDAFSVASVTRSFTSCSPATTTFHAASTHPGSPWNIGLTLGPSISRNAGAIVTPQGQIVNLNIADPTLTFLFGPTLSVPFSALNVPLSLSSVLSLTGQMVIVDATQPDGISLSQATELHVVQGSASIPGPTGDDSAISVVFSNPAFCAFPSTFPFYGTAYTKMDVISNGRIMFGAPTANVSFTPTVATAATDYPFGGAWVDLNPSVGGSITVSTPNPGILRVDWVGVPYFATAINNTFGIQLDAPTGTVTIDGLGGIAASTANQFLGISPGAVGGATNAGPVTYAVGGPFAAPGPTAMIYAFGPTGSLTPGLSTVVFVPSGSNYNWLAY